MSLYGQVKRVASSTFQFDKVYHTRSDLEDNCTIDGVYAGRYVLVNYGENGIRYEPFLDDNGQKQYEEDGTLIVKETDIYIHDYEEDLNRFGATYDSTVWQKIYGVESGEKYVMVAELNCSAPQLRLVVENPLEYKNINNTDNDEPEQEEDIYIIGKDNNNHLDAIRLEDTYESYKQPEFNLVHSNELGYYLHLPKPVEVDLANKNINYNKKGLDIAYSEPKEDNDYNSFIVWTPEPQGILNEDDVNGEEVIESDKKSLYINLPDIGNVIQMFYDVIYGKGDPDSNNVRAYFEQYWRDAGENIDGTERYYGNDNEEWLNNVPLFDGLLANNTEGLMGILSKLFCLKDPLNGTVRYYFNTDWNNSYDYDSNAPYIDNKPKVVGYNINKTEFQKVLSDANYNESKNYFIKNNDNYIPFIYSEETGMNDWNNALQNEQLYEQINVSSQSYCDYKINYNTWTLSAVI